MDMEQNIQYMTLEIYLNIHSRNNSTSKYKQFLTLISSELQGKSNSTLMEGFLGAI